MRKPPPPHRTSTRDNWMVTYGSLLTGVLAFFLLLVGSSTSEAESVFQFTDNLTSHIGEQIRKDKERNGFTWLYVENTGNKGIKLLIPSAVDDQPMFASGSGSIREEFFPYLDHVVEVLNRTDLPIIELKYDSEIDALRSAGKEIDVNVRVEGHTDPRNISTTEFRDNWDLSTARAYHVMLYMKERLRIEEKNFSMAGYAYFHPLHALENFDENRRVEIYIKINMIDGKGTD